MAFLKSLSKQAWFHYLLCRVIAYYIRFVRYTSRWQVEGTEDRDRLHAEGKPFIIALWHNRIGMMPYAYVEQLKNLCVVASGHRDGQIVTKAMGHFGISSISIDSRNPSIATRAIIKRLKAGHTVGITPDGPRGPRLVVKNGMIAIAAMAGVPIVPVTYAMNRRRILNTWDLFHLPIPFSRGICRWGPAIHLPEKPTAEQREACRLEIETALNDLSDDCDRDLGTQPTPRAPEPAPEPAPETAQVPAEGSGK